MKKFWKVMMAVALGVIALGARASSLDGGAVVNAAEINAVAVEDRNVLVENGGEKAYYQGFVSAIEEAKENATVTLLDDVGLEGDSLYINKAITIDLKGRDIDVMSSEDLVITAAVTIKDSVGGGYVWAELCIESVCTLEGGEYYYINCAEGIAVREVLGYGRHFYVYDETAGKDVLATDKQIENGFNLKVIRDCTHADADMTWNETVHKENCLCGWSLERAHVGGEATCTSKAICLICEQAYGEPLMHDYEAEADATHHWKVCSLCEGETDKEEHKGGTATTSKQAVCEVCGEEYGELLTEEPEASEGEGDTLPEEEKGCNGSVGGGLALSGLALIGLVFVRKRKEN